MAKRRATSSHGPSEIWQRPALVKKIHQEQLRVGRAIRELRHERELTQEAAAELMGIHSKYLGEMELGKVNPSLGVLVSVAEAFKVSLLLFR